MSIIKSTAPNGENISAGDGLDELEELFQNGMLMKINPSPLKSALSIKEAKLRLEEAKLNLKSGIFRSSRISCYMAFYHAARSILLRDGVQEENPHYLAPYLMKYSREGLLEEEWPELFGWMLNLHHQDLYHFQAIPSPEDAELSISLGVDFVGRIKILLEETKSAKRAFIKQNAAERSY